MIPVIFYALTPFVIVFGSRIFTHSRHCPPRLAECSFDARRDRWKAIGLKRPRFYLLSGFLESSRQLPEGITRLDFFLGLVPDLYQAAANRIELVFCQSVLALLSERTECLDYGAGITDSFDFKR